MPFLLPAAASAVAAAAPAAAASAAGAAASAGIGATLTSIAGNVLMNVAISAAMSVFQPQVGVAGRTFEWTLDPDGPIPFAAGRIGVPGSAVYRKTFGPDLMYYGIPSVLSGAGPIDGFEGFMADDETVTFDGSGKAVSSQYAGELWYKTKQGMQPDTAITSPTGLKNGATLPGWTSAHKLSGKACYMIVMGENSKGTAFPTGEIKPLITFRGLLVYDPRKDSTYPGGSGEHRLSNPLTWEYSSNPILWALKWTLGLWEGPNGKGAPQVDYQVGGIGAKLSGIDVPAFVAAANVADANGWTCAAYPTTDDDKHQVLTGFLQAGGAIYAQRAGKISCIQRAAPRTSIVTVSAYDTAGPLEIDTAASRIDRINTLRPRFWSEPNRWQMTALDQEVTAQAYRDEDGAVRTRGIDYPYVTDAVQAGQLAALQIANTREGIAGVIPLKPHLQRIRPGDAFTITEAGFVLNGLKCLCLNTDYDPATGVVRVSFVSETDAKYPFALGQNPTPPTPQVLTPVDPRFVSPPGAGDWTVTPRPPSQGGTQQPGFDLTGFVSNSTATAIIVETGPSANGPWTQAYQGPPTVRNIPIDGLQPGATYFIAIQYQRNQNYSEREVFGPFTAPDLVAGDLSPESPTRIAVSEITDRLVSVEQISATNAAAVADLEEVFGDTVSAAASAASAIQQAAIATQAKADAILAEGGALAAKADAIQAKSDALIAAGDAADRASEANEERIKAETARGQAEGFRNQSAASASTATGAASTATEQAGLAATARGEAQGFAGAALESRNQASGFATAAETAAAVSTSQKLEAVAALNAMGRQNIVARENATTPADVFTVTTGGVSGWGFSMVGTGSDAQERSIAVGPLKQNTPYSLSFMARRLAGSGSKPIVFDLFPDTLPQWEFDIQSNAWTRYTWENFSSDHSDMTMPSVLARFFRPNMEVDVNVEITDIKLEEGATATAYTPSPKDAAASAKASAQSASQASASETAAGQQAATATQERIDAQTARGQAEGFRNQSAASATTATGAASTATEQAGLSASARDAAQGHASSALTSRNQASGFATDAEAAAAVSTTQKLEAIAARDIATEKATASAQSASNAAASETAAGQSASAANTAKVAAETARGQAEAFKNETASSLDTATAQAALATAQAGLSAGSATLAGQKAGASSDSASLASTKADEAGASAAASRADQISAGAARDQALAALMAQGRQNLVARENVASGQLVAVSSGGASGWGFSMVGSGGNVTRSIKVGPLKKNTAYSLSFMARRSGVDPVPLKVDLFPDSLPETAFNITSENWTRYTWEGITSASDDMALATILLRFFELIPAGNAFEITDIKLEEGATATAWTPSPKDAAYSASASATSAASAAASDTAAGQSATAASGSATTAATKAGEASTFASQASTSAGNANTAAINAGVSATSAASRAGGNIVAMGSFSDGTIGTWTGSVANVAVSGVPDGSTRALRSTGRDAYEGSLISGVWGGRRLRVSGYGVAPGPYPFKIGIHGQTAANGSHWVTTLASPANTTSWATFSGEIVVPADVNRLRPFIQSEGPQGAPDHNVQIATLRIEDVTESASAANSAAVATSQAASASASAADASISANLAASTSAVRGNLLPNGGMERGLEGISGPNLYVSNDSWGPAVRVAPAGNGTYGIQWAPVNIFGGATYTVSGDALLFADSGYRYFDMQFFDSAGAVIKDGGQKPMGPGNYSNDRARINDMAWTEQAPANATKVVVRAIFENVVNPTAMGARRVKLELGAGPATAYTTDAAIGALSSQLNITAAVAADVATRMASVEFSVTGGAGGDPFDISLKAGPTGSDASITATKVRLRNIVNGEAIEALRIENGKSKFFGDVEVNGGSMNFNNRFIVAQDGTTTIRSGQTGERMWIEGKTIRGWYANGQQAYQLG